MTHPTRAELVEAMARAMATHFSMNRMPHMSGDPLARLGSQERRRLDDATQAALTTLCTLIPGLTALLDGTARVVPVDQWRPIETAPRDKTTVLLWDSVVGVVQAWWDGQEWVHSWDSERIPGQDALALWMPLPAAPERTP